MAEKEIFLTIAIPTYNRPEDIQKQVRNLLPQLSPGESRLIVYDNASPIPVESLFSDEEKRKFEIRRNPVNIGGDANVARCFEACCHSEWGYVPGDDDELFPDVIARIMNQIRQNPQAIFINFGCDTDEILNSEEEFLCSLGRWASYGNALCLSKGVYHTGLMQECYFDLNKFSYTVAPQLIFTLSYLKRHERPVVRLTEPLFAVATQGGWNVMDAARRLFPLYDFWSSKEKKQKGVRCFLNSLLIVQIYYIRVHLQRISDLQDRDDMLFLLKRIFAIHNPLWCLVHNPRDIFLIYLSLFFPFGHRFLLYITHRHRKKHGALA